MIKPLENKTRVRRAFHSNRVSLILSAALLGILLLIMQYLQSAGPEWYKTEQDVTINVVIQRTDLKEKLLLQVNSLDFSVDSSVQSYQSFVVSSKPQKFTFSLKTPEHRIIRIDTLEFTGADNINYHIENLYKTNPRIEAEIDVFEFYPL